MKNTKLLSIVAIVLFAVSGHSIAANGNTKPPLSKHANGNTKPPVLTEASLEANGNTKPPQLS